MLTLQQIRQNPDAVKAGLLKKYFGQPELVDLILGLDDQRKKLQLESDNLQAKINSASKEIGMLMGKGQKEEAEQKKQEVASFKAALQPLAEQLAIREQELQQELVRLPNLPAAEVPHGKAAADNVVVREGGSKPSLAADAVPHWDLIKKYQLVDFETGAKITGSGFPLYKGKGAKLQRALVQYFLDFNTAAGYTEYLPPLLVNEASAYG
ncbi:MAG: serine--tRNA ligase, partial [Bacteroidota bacterium]